MATVQAEQKEADLTMQQARNEIEQAQFRIGQAESVRNMRNVALSKERGGTDILKAVAWINKNRERLRGHVYDPIQLSVGCRDTGFARQLEACVNQATMRVCGHARRRADRTDDPVRARGGLPHPQSRAVPAVPHQCGDFDPPARPRPAPATVRPRRGLSRALSAALRRHSSSGSASSASRSTRSMPRTPSRATSARSRICIASCAAHWGANSPLQPITRDPAANIDVDRLEQANSGIRRYMTAETRVTIGYARLGTQDKFVSTSTLPPSHVFKVSGSTVCTTLRLIRTVDQRLVQEQRHRMAEAQTQHDAAETALEALQARDSEIRAAHQVVAANHVRRSLAASTDAAGRAQSCPGRSRRRQPRCEGVADQARCGVLTWSPTDGRSGRQEDAGEAQGGRAGVQAPRELQSQAAEAGHGARQARDRAQGPPPSCHVR